MKVNFKTKQSEFSAYIRDPFNNPKPTDVKKQRIDTYRELFFNNINSFLSSNFPVLNAILTDEEWFELTQDFFSKHPCSTPYFSEIPEEFINYLQEERQNNPADYPFLLELAHYEWVEMALSISKDELSINPQELIDTLYQHQIRLSDLAWPLAYQYPVHQISPELLPQGAATEPTYLLVYRNIVDEVNFIQLAPLTFRLLQIIQQTGTIDCESCLIQLAEQLANDDKQQLINGGLQTLQDLARKHIISVLA